jgi:hypothetical protein
MKRVVCLSILATFASCGAFAQSGNVMYQSTGMAPGNLSPGPATMTVGAFAKGAGVPVQGAPYSATIVNESVQTLADGNRIVNTGGGTIARDSQGRTRQDAPLPSIGNLAAANAPHIVFIQDPVAQVSYTLNLTDKTAQKMSTASGAPGMPGMAVMSGGAAGAGVTGPVTAPSSAAVQTFSAHIEGEPGAAAMMPLPPLPPMLPAGGPVMIQRAMVASDPSQITEQDLGTQTMEGVAVRGTRTTHTIPAGQIGNDAPIAIVTEVWTSPDLKTVVYSKRDDPRMGEQTFQLKSIVRAEPDASLFTVPADFTVTDGPKPIMYRLSQ